jgi:thioredoxin reductase
MDDDATASEPYDVIVIGGGAAGLSGALTLARARRTVLVLDAGEPRNAPATGVHGFLTRDGLPPAELVRLGAAEVTRYGGRIRHTRATTARRTAAGFTVETTDGHAARGRRLLLATGLHDELPDVAGLRERWGRDVLHCPYCHGWEFRDDRSRCWPPAARRAEGAAAAAVEFHGDPAAAHRAGAERRGAGAAGRP